MNLRAKLLSTVAGSNVVPLAQPGPTVAPIEREEGQAPAPSVLSEPPGNVMADMLAELDGLVQQQLRQQGPRGDAAGATPTADTLQAGPIPLSGASAAAAPSASTAAPTSAGPATKLNSIADAIEWMNKKYFLAPSGSGSSPSAGEVLVWREAIDAHTGRLTVAPVSKASVYLDCAPHTVTVATTSGAKSMQVPDLWFRSKCRREYPGGVVLQPEGPTRLGCYNMWRGFAVERKLGNPGPLIVLVYALCGRNRDLAEYVLDWLAFRVQRPGTRPEVALVLRGRQGTGKGTLMRVMLKIFGRHGLHVTQPRHLTGHFNAPLQLTIFLFCDEGYWASDKEGTGVLKGLVTEPKLIIEPKGRDAFEADNRLAIVIASNSRWVVPAGADERRFCVVDVADEFAQDHAYFADLNAWIEADGAAIFLDHLLSRDLSGFNVRAAPKTAALDSQKIEGMPPLDRWLMEALDTGVSFTPGEWTEGPQRVPCGAAAASFEAYCRRTGARGFKADARTIGTRLAEVFGCGPAVVGASGADKRERAWMLPGLNAARASAAAAFGLAQYTWGAV